MQKCQESLEEECETVVEQKCTQSFETECDTIEEEECYTKYEEKCEPVFKVLLMPSVLSSLSCILWTSILSAPRNGAQPSTRTFVLPSTSTSAKRDTVEAR